MTIAANLSYLQDNQGNITSGTFNIAAAPFTIAIASSEKVRIDNNGYLLVNRTTSQGNYHLQVQGNTYISGTMEAGTIIASNFAGVSNTSTNLSGGDANQIVYQTAPGQTGFLSVGPINTILVGTGNAPNFQNFFTLGSTTDSTNTQTGALIVRGGAAIQKNLYVFGNVVSSGTIVGSVARATTATYALTAGTATTATDALFAGTATFAYTASTSTHLAGGATGSIVLQTAAGRTSFLAIGANQYVLTSDGSNPTWAPLSGVSAGSALTATNIAFGTAGQIPYQSSPGVTVFVGPGNTGEILVSRSTSGPIFQNTLTLAGTTAASSTMTGAFQVRGGVGIGGNLYVGGTIYGLSGEGIRPRVVSYANATSITLNADTTDIATQTNTQAAGTLTFAAPTGTPYDGQKILVRLQCTNSQSFSFNAVFQGSSEMALPTSSSSGSKYDYMGFIYNSTASKWQLIAKMFGF